MSELVFQMACMRFLGLPYIWGGDDSIRGYDCSGLVQELLAILGLDPVGDQSAQALYDHFKDNSTKGRSITGSLCFYGTSIQHVTHVAMIISYESVIEAGGGGSKTLTAQDAISQNAFVRLRPYDRRKDLVAVLCPKGLPWSD